MHHFLVMWHFPHPTPPMLPLRYSRDEPFSENAQRGLKEISGCGLRLRIYFEAICLIKAISSAYGGFEREQYKDYLQVQVLA